MTTYGIDTTKPSTLYPNEPGTRNEWWVLKADGYRHRVSASYYEYTNEYETAGTIYVHIGCGVMIKDAVRDGEYHWDAIRRVVTTWQQEQRDADHVAALEIMATVDADMEEVPTSGVRPCDYCHTDAHQGCPDCGTHPYMPGGRCTPCMAKVRRAEREAGKTPQELYSMYISDGLADTDGYFAPLTFDAWAHSAGHAL